MSATPDDAIRATLTESLPDGWRHATADERAGLICRPDEIVVVRPDGEFRRVQVWTDRPASLASLPLGLLRALESDPETLTRLRAAMAEEADHA